jgi:hypothetical protein
MLSVRIVVFAVLLWPSACGGTGGGADWDLKASLKHEAQHANQRNVDEALDSLTPTTSSARRDSNAKLLLKCQQTVINGAGQRKRAVIAIYSALRNTAIRDAIRTSWLSDLPSNMLAYFVLSGVAPKPDVQTTLDGELKRTKDRNEGAGDLVFLGDLQQESYKSIDIKMLATMQWAWSSFGTFPFLPLAM